MIDATDANITPLIDHEGQGHIIRTFVHEGKHKVRLAMHSGNSSCFLVSSECERIFFL